MGAISSIVRPHTIAIEDLRMNFGGLALGEDSMTESVLLIDVLLRVSQTVRLRFNDWLSNFELNDGRYSVLKALQSAGDTGCSQAELAERLEQSESNISTLIERMQRDGLVERLRSHADRRKRVLLISPEGRLLLTRIDERRPAWASRLLQADLVGDRAMLIRMLRQIGSNLEAIDNPSANSFERSGQGSDGGIRTPIEHYQDPIADPQSPQFALQQMLLALSSQSGTESAERDVA